MGPTMGQLWSKFDALSLINGLLHRTFEDNDGKFNHLQICLPRKIIKEVLECTHDMLSKCQALWIEQDDGNYKQAFLLGRLESGRRNVLQKLHEKCREKSTLKKMSIPTGS